MLKLFLFHFCAMIFFSSGLLASFAPQVSEFFITEDADFEIDTERRVVEYDVALRARKPLPKGSVIQVRFQNPNRKGEDIVREVAVEDDNRKFRITSGNVSGLKLKKDYRIDITLFASPEKERSLGEHSQRLFFEVPKRKYKREVRSWYEDGSEKSSSSPKESSSKSERRLRERSSRS